MFLNEIDKNEFEYLEKIKGCVKETFINFYGEKHRELIEAKLNNTPIICYDRKGIDSNFALKKIDHERNILLLEWFESAFDLNNVKDTKKLLTNIESIKDEIDFSENADELQDIINEILNDNIFSTNEDYSNQIQILLNNFYSNYKNDFDTLLDFEDEMLYNKENFKTNKNFESFEELEEKNSFVKRISAKLNENQKKSLLICSNLFINRDTSRGFLYMDCDKICNNTFLAFPQLKILDIGLFLHELNHAISYDFKRNNDIAITCTGVFKRQRNLTTNKIEENYCFLNEVITDYFVYEMDLKSLDEKKLCFDLKSNSAYSLSFILIKPFMDNYFKDIKECYITSDVDKFEKLFGKHNLEALDHILEDFSGYVQTMEKSGATLVNNFEEGFDAGLNINESYVPSYVTKYYNGFLKMQSLIDNIERYQKNNLELSF